MFDFWIKKGVDGLLMDDVHTIFENEDLTQDEPFNEFVKDPQPVRKDVFRPLPEGGLLRFVQVLGFLRFLGFLHFSTFFQYHFMETVSFYAWHCTTMSHNHMTHEYS